MNIPTVTETAVLDRALEVGSQSQTITVNGSVEAVQTTSSALGSVAAGDTVTALPLNTRNYTNLLSMAAGANSNVENAITVGKGSVFIAVNGAGFGQNTYLQDGVSVDSWFSFNTGTEGKSNGSFAIPIPDDIAEFSRGRASKDKPRLKPVTTSRSWWAPTVRAVHSLLGSPQIRMRMRLCACLTWGWPRRTRHC